MSSKRDQCLAKELQEEEHGKFWEFLEGVFYMLFLRTSNTQMNRASTCLGDL